MSSDRKDGLGIISTILVPPKKRTITDVLYFVYIHLFVDKWNTRFFLAKETPNYRLTEQMKTNKKWTV